MTTALFDTMTQLEATFDRFMRFNPNHVGSGPHGGQFAPGHGKHYARRQRRKAKLQAMRKAGHKEIADQRKRHRGERKEMVSSQKQDAKRVAKEHKSEAKSNRRDYQKDVAAIRKEYSSTPGKIKREGKEKLLAARDYHQKLAANMKEGHKQEWKELGEEHASYRKDAIAEQKKERRQLVDDLKKELRDQFPKRKAKRSFSRSRTAFAAEDIRNHILGQRGWTKRWRDGDLSGKQHLSLLEDCRQFGRARLRHYAEVLFDEHGVEDEFQELGQRSQSATGDDGRLDAGLLQRDVASSEGDSEGSTPAIVRSVASRASGAVTRFFRRTKQFVHELITAGAMLLKGDEPLTHDELQAIDRQARKQHEYLDGFEREVRANPPREISDLSSQVVDVMPDAMSSGQFIARAESYGDAVWQGGQAVNRTVASGAGHNEERRVLGDAMHCADCPPLAALGWQPIGTLPMIGDTECGGHCHCHFEYRVDANSKATPVPKKPKSSRPRDLPRPKPPEAKTAEPPPPQPEPVAPPPKKIDVPQEQAQKPKPLKPAGYPPERPLPTVQELLEEAGSPYAPSDYEEA